MCRPNHDYIRIDLDSSTRGEVHVDTFGHAYGTIDAFPEIFIKMPMRNTRR